MSVGRSYIFRQMTVIVIILVAGIMSLKTCNTRNHAPTIKKIVADKLNLDPSSNCKLTCMADDKDDDMLTYKWSSSQGAINGKGAVVNWKTPQAPGRYRIAIEVSDGSGTLTSAEKMFYVGENHPPVIKAMIAEYIAVERGKTCQLRCDAEDPDNDALSYEWTVNRGGISGSGATAAWTAPNSYVNTIITLIVDDGRGQEKIKKLIIPVVCCDGAKKNPDW